MTILLWAAFGMINGLLIQFLTGDTKSSKAGAAVVGSFGAISGGAFAYLLFGPATGTVTISSLLILALEGGLLMLLLSGKAFTRRAIQ